MGYIDITLTRDGETPTAHVERIGESPIAQLDMIGSTPLVSMSKINEPIILELANIGGEITVNGAITPTVGNDTLTISETSLSFTNAEIGVTKSIAVLATAQWSVELIDPNGLFELSTTAGLPGVVGRVAITLIASNPNVERYSASVVFKSRGLRQILTLVAEASAATYTPLTYIEATGAQYINTGLVLSETDTIEAYYDYVVESGDKFLFFAGGSSGSTWLSCYSNSAYVRFGHTASETISNGVHSHYIKLKKDSVVLDVTTTELDFTGASTGPLQICGANSSDSGLYNLYKGKVMMIRVVDEDGNVKLELRPCKRDGDGKVGMLDIVSGTFYISEGDADFIGGNEIRITDDYKIIDRVSFNKDKAFNTGFYGNNTTYIDVMFQRTSTSAAAYLFGLTQGNRLTGYLAANSSYWRYGKAYPTFSLATLKICKAAVTPGKTTIDATSRTFTVNEFETSDPIPVGGYKSGTDPITKHYIGYIYYFRMRHGDTLLLDWHPCKRLSDGVEGFWDCVSQTFVESI